MEITGERFIPGQYGQIEHEHLNRYYFVINQIDLIDKIVIDLASGEGYGSVLLAKHAKKVYGIDISQEAIVHAKLKYHSENLEFQTGDASKIPLPDKIADVFVCFETIEHHDKHEEMIEEIKRVLKPDGILVISSPDKYYFSDLSKIKNEFHIKELYYDQFKALINNKFKRCFFFSQKIFVGSIIAFNEKLIPYKKPLTIDKNGEALDFNPVYNIAVASDQPNLILKYPIIGFYIYEKIITENDLEIENWRGQQKIRNTKSYKLGHFIIHHIKKIVSVIKHPKYFIRRINFSLRF